MQNNPLFSNPFKPKLTAQTARISLTSGGKDKIDKLAPGSQYYIILTAIADEQPCTLADIAKETNMQESQVKYLVNELIKVGCLKAE